MSNDKTAATFGRTPAVVHLSILYDAVCHECGWSAEGNPYASHDDADDAATAHRCRR